MVFLAGEVGDGRIEPDGESAGLLLVGVEPEVSFPLGRADFVDRDLQGCDGTPDQAGAHAEGEGAADALAWAGGNTLDDGNCGVQVEQEAGPRGGVDLPVGGRDVADGGRLEGREQGEAGRDRAGIDTENAQCGG